MRPQHIKLALLPMFALIALLVISCSPAFDNSSPPQTFTPHDVSPSTLTVTMNITADQNDLYPGVLVDMHFSSDQITNPSPNTVNFMNESEITCNGTKLNFDGSEDYTANVLYGTNGAFTCRYTWNGGSRVIPTHEQTPLSPTIELQGKSIIVNYNSTGGCQVEVEASDGNQTVSNTAKQDAGSISINVSSLSGAGTLKLTRTCTFKSFDAGFNEVDETNIAILTRNVTWNAPH